MCFRSVLATIGFLFAFIQSISQSWNMSPQPPDQGMFSRYGNYPVSYYTGTPQISVPLYTIKERGIEVPLDLTYAGTGIRVADESTWVGMGWNLYPGGSISRIAVGSQYDEHLPDVYDALYNQWESGTEVDYVRRHGDQPTGYVFRGSDIEGAFLTTADPRNEPYTILPGFPVSSMNTWSQTPIYFQPDVYAFNFLGYSGKFFINPKTNEPVIMQKKENILFEKDNTPWDPELNGWRALLPSGIIVYFQDVEKVHQTIQGCGIGAPSITWKITKIQLINGQEIQFTYSSFSYQTATISNIDVYAYEDDQDYQLNYLEEGYTSTFLPFPMVDCADNKFPVPVLYQLKILQKISSPSYSVEFTTAPNQVRPKLQKIEIYANNRPASRIRYQFGIEEFIKADLAWNQTYSAPGNPPTFFGDEMLFEKFKLTSIQKFGLQDGVVTETENPHLFFYHEDIGLPSALTFAQDYWGYYNGQHANRGLIPDETQMYANEGYFPVAYLPDRRPADDLRARANANRGISIEHMRQGNLNKIIYPTKGWSKFVFDSHEFYLSDLTDYLLMAHEMSFDGSYYHDNYTGSHTAPSKGAGLRIKEIVNYDSNNTFTGRTKFDYDGSGVLLEPVHFWNVERHLQTNSTGTARYLYKIWNASGSSYDPSFLIPNSVGYTHVVVKKSGAEFDGPDEEINGSVQFSFHNYETVYDPRHYKVSFAYLNPKNGLPLSVTQRDTSATTIKRVEYNYELVGGTSFLSMAAKKVCESSTETYNVFKIEYTPLNAGCWKEAYVIETIDGVQSTTFNNYSTDGYANLTERRVEYLSDVSILKTKYRYPVDYEVVAETSSTSDPEYDAIKSLVERNMVDTPLEIIEMRDDKLVKGMLTTYRLFNGVPLPYQMFAIKSPSALDVNPIFGENDIVKFDWSFISRPQGATGPAYLMKDNAYGSADVTFSSYDTNSNLKEYLLSSGQKGAYKWGYKKSNPVVQLENGENNLYYVYNPSATTESISFGGASGAVIEVTFSIDYRGPVKIRLGVSDTPSFTTIADYAGITVNSRAATLQTGGCGLTETIFDDVPPGTYTLIISLSSPEGATTLGACGEVEYPINVAIPNGIIEFMHENFEESDEGLVIENQTVAHSGLRYYQGDFTVNFIRPNTRTYIIEYFYLQNGKWMYIRKPYESSTMLLSEGDGIDDIRIYPSDARMTTFTYDALSGITSKTDPNCITSYYDYDGLGRLIRIRDDQKNVLKSYNYHYKTDQ